jgi:NAD(P)-dependent dehydrogenase (short-subunit alcohol dehydrogenase family)
MRGLKGRTAIVTGGAAGIGAAIVKRFRDEGTRVEIFDLNASPALDITDYAAVKSAVERVGPVDILVNNAGITKDMTFRKMGKADGARSSRPISIRCST